MLAEIGTCRWCSAPRESVHHPLFERRNWQKERKRMYETFSRSKVLRPRPLEDAPEMRIFGRLVYYVQAGREKG
jgi:hypothetical protein